MSRPENGGSPLAPGLRVVLDARPLQVPDRSPVTAVYLDALVAAYEAAPLPGESFVLLLHADLDDPTARFGLLPVAGRRLLPPTRLLRSAALTLDPFLVRGAALGAAWRAGRSGAAGAVYHAAAGAVPVPILSDLPTVVTLLDLAPWAMPHAFQRGGAARLGQRLRGALLRHAAAVIVPSEAVATAARRLLRLRRDRLRVVPLAARDPFRRPLDQAAVHRERSRLGLGERYLVYAGRFDARHDVPTLLRALADLAGAGRPAALPGTVEWPPRVLLVGASPDDRAALARAAAREGVGDVLSYAPLLEPARLAALVGGARATILPVVSDAAGLAAIEAIAAGTPVVASAVDGLPALVGRAGILVAPRDAPALARGLATIWHDDAVHAQLAAVARDRTDVRARGWGHVAAETRVVYAAVGTPPSSASAAAGPASVAVAPGHRRP